MFSVYKITNTLNKKYYVGVHYGENPYDDYMGSGNAIKAAISKYGLENFTKDILFLFEEEQQAYDKEEEILRDIWFLDECYNMKPGGIGGWSHIDSSGKNNCMKDPEVVKKVFITRRQRGTTEAMRTASIENGKKGAAARKGKKDSEDVKTKRNKSVSNKLNEPEVKQKLIDGIRSFRCVPYILIDPNGIEYKTDVISELCAKLNIPLSTVTTHADGRQIKRGKLKGWTIYKKGGEN